MDQAKKITRATLKAFILKNRDKLFHLTKNSFDGHVDCVMPTSEPVFKRVNSIEIENKTTFGIKDAWLVGNGDDYFTLYEDAQYIGIEVSNCCANWIVVIKKLTINNRRV